MIVSLNFNGENVFLRDRVVNVLSYHVVFMSHELALFDQVLIATDIPANSQHC